MSLLSLLPFVIWFHNKQKNETAQIEPFITIDKNKSIYNLAKKEIQE